MSVLRRTVPGLRLAGRPGMRLGLVLLALLFVLIVLPLVRITLVTLSPDGLVAWQDALIGRLSVKLFYEPLLNTLFISVLASLGCILLGGFLAWLVILTDVPGRGLLGSLASLSFVIPSFAVALAWQVLFRNDRVGGSVGLFQELGLAVPDWLAWGFVPVVLSLITHYYSLSFLLISAGLASVSADVLEAAHMTGANRFRILRGITFPLVLPAILASAVLTFASTVSNFASPALLGLPVRFETLSTRMYGMIRIGQVERGYVLALLLIVISAVILWYGNHLRNKRGSHATITGKGGRVKRFELGRWRYPMFVIALGLCVLTAVLPTLVLIASSFATQKGSLLSGFSSHYWVGASNPDIAQGQAGVLRNPQVLNAGLFTLAFGGAVAFIGTFLGLLFGYAIAKTGGWLANLLAQFSYLPLLIPGIAFGAAYIALFSQPMGPFPALYGTFALMVIAGIAYTLPFAVQAGQAAMTQVSGELEESARMTGATLPRRLANIFFPLTARGLLAGTVLTFVKMVRDLSLVVLLFTPATPVLSVVAFRYASEGFLQFANAITVIIALISVTTTLLAQRLQGQNQPWRNT
jgi:iron(III) transport system permease protein